MNPEAIVELGFVSGAHGLRGEVLVRPHNLASDLPRAGMTVQLTDAKGKARQVRVTASRKVSKGVLVAFEGIPDRDSAEAIRGSLVGVRRGDLPPLEEGEFYYHDLPGLAVRLPDGTEVGRVADVFTGGAGDILVLDVGGREILIPVIPGFVEDVTSDAVIVTPEALEE